jgi:hypothetical protein
MPPPRSMRSLRRMPFPGGGGAQQKLLQNSLGLGLGLALFRLLRGPPSSSRGSPGCDLAGAGAPRGPLDSDWCRDHRLGLAPGSRGDPASRARSRGGAGLERGATPRGRFNPGRGITHPGRGAIPVLWTLCTNVELYEVPEPRPLACGARGAKPGPARPGGETGRRAFPSVAASVPARPAAGPPGHRVPRTPAGGRAGRAASARRSARRAAQPARMARRARPPPSRVCCRSDSVGPARRGGRCAHSTAGRVRMSREGGGGQRKIKSSRDSDVGAEVGLPDAPGRRRNAS